MFQKCPICNGTGYSHDTFSTSTMPVCSTCKGKKIINSETGLPPMGEMKTGRLETISDILKYS